MEIVNYYNFEKEGAKANSIKVGDVLKGFYVDYVDVENGVVLVDEQCKDCGQALRLFEALGDSGLCQECK